MAVPKDVENLGIACRKFLFITEISGLAVLMFFMNKMSLFDFIRMIAEAILAGFYYIKSTDSSGEPLDVDEDLELQNVSLSNIMDQSINEISHIPERNRCQECKLVQPYRTKHCQKCQKCIPKYDHHCFWIGGCVGELNHRLFWLFLFFQCSLCFEALLQFYEQLQIYSINDELFGNDSYEPQYFLILLYASLTFGFTLFTGVLLVYHTILIMNGKTTWENTKREKISYLNYYPQYYNPYNFGILKNIWITFFHGNQLNQWIPPERSQINQQFNIFDNKYYSCC